MKHSLLKELILAANTIGFQVKNDRSLFAAIRGFPKSGTNWLGNLMKLHPNICVTGEWGFTQLAERREHLIQTTTWTASHAPHMSGVLEREFERMIRINLFRGASAEVPFWQIKCLVDKTPSHAYPPVIQSSKCLYIIRDVRDVIVSRAYHLLRVNGTWGLNKSPRMLEKLRNYGDSLNFFRENPEKLLDDIDWVRENARLWAMSVEQVLNADDNGFTSLYPDYQVQIIRYEDLHANVEAERNRCYTFLGLNPEKARPLDSGLVKTSAGFSSERPQEFYRKGAIGDWKNYFNGATSQAVLEEVAPLFEQLGYTV